MKGANEIEIQDFKGFSPEAFRFLRSLKRNNRREWFQPRKDTYLELLHYPMIAALYELQDQTKSFAPEIGFNPKKNILRVYRDVRFSKDKSPYKTFVAANLPFGMGKKGMDSVGLYMAVETDKVFVAGGLYMPSSLQLRKVREAILKNPDEFLDIVEDKTFKKHFKELQGDKLKTTPRGISPEHPMVEYLRLKQFFVTHTFDLSVATKKDFPKKIAQEFKAMMPLLRWLNKSQSLW